MMEKCLSVQESLQSHEIPQGGGSGEKIPVQLIAFFQFSFGKNTKKNLFKVKYQKKETRFWGGGFEYQKSLKLTLRPY